MLKFLSNSGIFSSPTPYCGFFQEAAASLLLNCRQIATEHEGGMFSPLSWKKCLSGFTKAESAAMKSRRIKEALPALSPSVHNKAKETRSPGTSSGSADYWPTPLHKRSTDTQHTARVNLPLPSILRLLFRLAQLTLCHLTRRIITRGKAQACDWVRSDGKWCPCQRGEDSLLETLE